MPTYEYRCPEGHDFEKFQKMSEKPRAKCPVCGKPATRQMSAGAGLVFKGSGFYITDYGKDGKGARKEGHSGAEPTEKAEKTEKSEKSEKADKSPKAEAKSETKPAKAESKSPPKKAAE
jgi:putative FmdB family regulatory protein